MINWKRTIRTAASERFVASRDGHEVAAVDLHYHPSGEAVGTVVLLRSAPGGWEEAQIADLLACLDHDLLPDVDSANGSLTYTVVLGELVGNYESSAPGSDS